MFPHYPWLNSFPFHSFLLSQLLSHHFHCCPRFSLPSDIFKPSPWGEQKLVSIWNQLFCSVHESRTKPRQKNSCKDRCVICFCPSYRLCRYQSIYCAAVLQLWMQKGPEASQHIKAVTNMEQGPNGEKCCGHKWNKPEQLLIRSHF